jgi:hypothetical protein
MRCSLFLFSLLCARDKIAVSHAVGLRTFKQIALLVLGTPPAQRRFGYAEILCNSLDAASAGQRQPHRLPFELVVNRLCLFLLIATSAIFHRGWLSTFAGQVHRSFQHMWDEPPQSLKWSSGLTTLYFVVSVWFLHILLVVQNRGMSGSFATKRISDGASPFLDKGEQPVLVGAC